VLIRNQDKRILDEKIQRIEMMTTPYFDRWNRAFKEGTSVVGERCCNSASTSAHASSADSTGNWNAGYDTTNSWFYFCDYVYMSGPLRVQRARPSGQVEKREHTKKSVVF
jgi:hypothetical protein